MVNDIELMKLMQRCGHVIDHRKCLSQSQSRVLTLLNQYGPMTQKELLEKMHIKSGSLSEVVQKVENAGYVVKTRNENDRRNFDLSLTEKGKEKALWCLDQREFIAHYLFEDLTDEQKKELEELLNTLLEHWVKFRSCSDCSKGEM